ncbi:hypothetical protein WJX84_010381 [Apatococcus fuscideae]|uniref:RRP15-like protein n=1 Tax=Apatococcus fuscideae TaxID=2026836 RepID=A0AAW1TG58_9CHLO
MAEVEVEAAVAPKLLKPRKKRKLQKPGPATEAAAAIAAAARAGLDINGGLDSDTERDDPDELAAADEEADKRTSRTSGATPSSASFADAFAEILAHPGPSGGQAAPILAASKSLAKRKRDEAETEAGQKEHRRLRLEMRRRGHVVVPKRGENPQIDIREKELARTATRGVVRLFNAVAAAQQKQADLEASGGKGAKAKLSKASFLAELRASAEDPSDALHDQEPVVAARPGPQGRQAGFSGLQGGSKLKDWDREDDSDDAPPDEQFQDMGGSESD